jgi:quercetin dioxygenase-like cupin family protein
MRSAAVAVDEVEKWVCARGPAPSYSSAMKKVNIAQELASLQEYWSQKIIAKANGQLFKVAKGVGEVNWHKHDDQDELFILYKGHLTVRLRSENVKLGPGDLFVVPRGVEHAPRADEDAEFLVVGLDVTSTDEGGKPAWSYTRRE